MDTGEAPGLFPPQCAKAEVLNSKALSRSVMDSADEDYLLEHLSDYNEPDYQPSTSKRKGNEVSESIANGPGPRKRRRRDLHGQKPKKGVSSASLHLSYLIALPETIIVVPTRLYSTVLRPPKTSTVSKKVKPDAPRDPEIWAGVSRFHLHVHWTF